MIFLASLVLVLSRVVLSQKLSEKFVIIVQVFSSQGFSLKQNFAERCDDRRCVCAIFFPSFRCGGLYGRNCANAVKQFPVDGRHV